MSPCAKQNLTTLGILHHQAENANHVRALSSLRQRHRSTTSRLHLATSQLDDTRRDLEEQASAHVNLVKAHDEAERSLSSMMETIESLQTELEDAKKDVEEGKKVRSKLEKVVSGLRERCDDKQKELDAWLREEKGKDGEVSWRDPWRVGLCANRSKKRLNATFCASQVDKEIRSLKLELRNLRSELAARTEEVSELETEQERLRSTLHEKEKEIRRGARAAGAADKVGELEEEVENVKNRLASKEKELKRAIRAGDVKDEKIKELQVSYAEDVWWGLLAVRLTGVAL
jgi:chromosome segregation ATPase